MKKPLSYHRFRAYLRLRLKNKSFSKTRFFLIIGIYILFSLTLFLLPLDILAKYPYLKAFTDFMDFIPAIKQMESKSFAPELCKFYTSYMFIVAFVCFWFLLREMFVYIAESVLYPYAKSGIKTLENGSVGKIAQYPKKSILLIAVACCLVGFDIVLLFSGWSIGHSKYVSYDKYFLYDLFGVLCYAIVDVGIAFFTAAGVTSLGFSYFDIHKHHLKQKG